MGRVLLLGGLLFAPVAVLLRFVFHSGDLALFAVSAVALIPLAWLIGQATDHAGEHTGPGVGGFLNASFGNAPELIIALFAVNEGLPGVVRGSIAGSVVSNLLLVLGLAAVLGGGRAVDRISLLGGVAMVLWAALLLLVPSIPGWDGDPDRHVLAVVTLPVAAVLLAIYVGATIRSLRRHHELHLAAATDAGGAWSLRASLVTLGAATAATAVISEILVHSLEGFADKAGLSEFFVSAVIVAIVGNAAEHGGAVVIARRGKLKLASEIAVSSAAQVGLFVAPAVALLSWAVMPELSLSFRPVELATMAGAAVAVIAVAWNGRATRMEGWLLLAAYGLAVGLYGLAGDR